MDRSQKLKKNVILSIGLTIINLAISFLMYPMLIDLLGQSAYGCWLTIASVATWMTFFEFGLGSGLKNQLGIHIANSRFDDGKKIVSTAYFAIGCIVTILFIVFFCFRNVINWGELLGTNLSQEVLDSFVSIMISSYFIIFFLKLLGNVASAHQEPYIEKLITTSVHVACFIVVVILSYLQLNNLVSLSIYWALACVGTWVAFSIIYYVGRYRKVAPTIQKIDFSSFKPLLSLGFKFFIIQLSLIIINSSTNFIISHYINSGEVVTYNAAYKIFSLAQILYSIIIAPTWPAFIDAIEKKDVAWIKKIVSKMLRIWVLITASTLMLLILSPIVYKIWLGDRISIPFTLSLLLFLYFTTMTFGGVFNMYVNASGRLRTQVIYWSLVTILYIPFVIVLIARTNLGIFSIAIGLLLSNAYYVFIAPFQYRSFIKMIEHD